MLELLEVFDGLFLLLLYIALTVFVPVALLGLVIGIVAILARTVLAVLGRLGAVARIALPGGPIGRVGALLFALVPWAIGAIAIFYALSFLGVGGGAPTFAGTIGGGVRVATEAFARLQDGSMRFWTDRTLADVLATTGQTADLHALAAFTALVAGRVFTALAPDLSLVTFRWVFALATAALILLALGLAPVRAVASLRVPALPVFAVVPVAGRSRESATPPSRPVAPPPPPKVAPRPQAIAAPASRVAVVSPRGDLSRDLMAMAGRCGSITARHYSTLEEYEATVQADAVIMDARLLRWSEGSPTTNAHRRRTILAFASTEAAPDSSGFAGVIRCDEPVEHLRSILAPLVPAAQ